MSKVIEDAAQDFAAINDDKAANTAHSYSKYDIADAYQQGADFGYSLAENRIKKEYEEKLRWIPVEESMPIEREIVIIKVNRRLTEKVTSTHIAIGECLINSFTGNLWIFDKSYSAGYVTHWRHIL